MSTLKGLVVVTHDACEVITRFPAEELLVAGVRYHTVGGELSTERETESHRNTEVGRGTRRARSR